MPKNIGKSFNKMRELQETNNLWNLLINVKNKDKGRRIKTLREGGSLFKKFSSEYMIMSLTVTISKLPRKKSSKTLSKKFFSLTKLIWQRLSTSRQKTIS